LAYDGRSAGAAVKAIFFCIAMGDFKNLCAIGKSWLKINRLTREEKYDISGESTVPVSVVN